MNVSSPRFVARLATVQALRSLTRQVLELHRLDRISVSHHVFLSTQSTSLYFVMMSCNSELQFSCPRNSRPWESVSEVLSPPAPPALPLRWIRESVPVEDRLVEDTLFDLISALF